MKLIRLVRQIPTILAPCPLELNQLLAYKKLIFRNGEHHYVLLDNSEVPAVFFVKV